MAVAWRLRRHIGHPLFAEKFVLPGRSDLDARLISGSALFGIGWGLAGAVPGRSDRLACPGSRRGPAVRCDDACRHGDPSPAAPLHSIPDSKRTALEGSQVTQDLSISSVAPTSLRLRSMSVLRVGSAWVLVRARAAPAGVNVRATSPALPRYVSYLERVSAGLSHRKSRNGIHFEWHGRKPLS